jgi:hypothetical protein
MTQSHAERAHSVWSASATDRNWSCPGALALTKDLPETTSEPADWGTVAHEIAEVCLRSGRDPDEFVGQTMKGKKFEFTVDDEMAECVAEYVNYVRLQRSKAANAADDNGLLIVEQRFSLSALNPPFDAGGTADAVLYREDTKTLEIVDLKTGKGGTVEVDANRQLRTYALGALLANKGLDVQQVRSTIVQPRKPHKDGRIRSETYHVVDLLEWTGELLEAMKRSKEALDSVAQVDGNLLPQAAWNTTFLTPGDHCAKTFCGARGFCPALKQKVLDAASVWFDDQDKPRLANSPDSMSPEAIAQALDAADMIDGWINAVRAYAHTQAESGVTIPNYLLVEKIGRRAWTNEGEAVSRLVAAGHDPYTKKPVSPAQAEKLLGKKQASLIADLIEKPVTGTSLVRADKTTREPVQSAVSKFLQPIE